MARKKIVMEKHRKVMIGLLQTKFLTASEFYREAMKKGIPKATFYRIRDDEKLKPLEKQRIFMLSINNIDYYYDVYNNLDQILEMLSSKTGIQTDESRYKLHVWIEHSKKIKYTLLSLKEQMPTIDLHYNPIIKEISIDGLDECVPIEHLYLHDELGTDFKEMLKTMNECYNHFEGKKQSLLNNFSQLIASKFSAINPSIEPEPEFSRALYYALLQPDQLYELNTLRRLRLIHSNRYYCPIIDANPGNGWLLYRGEPSKEMDLNVNIVKNVVIDEVSTEKYEQIKLALIEDRKALVKKVNKFKSRLEFILTHENFLPCEGLL